MTLGPFWKPIITCTPIVPRQLAKPKKRCDTGSGVGLGQKMWLRTRGSHLELQSIALGKCLASLLSRSHCLQDSKWPRRYIYKALKLISKEVWISYLPMTLSAIRSSIARKGLPSPDGIVVFKLSAIFTPDFCWQGGEEMKAIVKQSHFPPDLQFQEMWHSSANLRSLTQLSLLTIL